MPQSSHLISKPDCTNICQSIIHGATINAVITKRAVTDKQLASYISNLCCNFSRVRDETGRSALHMAASCGRLGLCRWLVKYGEADLNARDKENASTPLHRSIFYGQINVAVFLIKVGANTAILDQDDLSCFDVGDSKDMALKNGSGGGQAYVWGANSNYTHGSGSQQTRAHPELVDYFRRTNITIRQICMAKFHTVFVSDDGRAWSCGVGCGGRLGLDSEGTFIMPQLMKTAGTDPVRAAAVARDHTILLMESGAVLSCGLNTHHQLGISPPPAKLLVPRSIPLKGLKVTDVIGVAAARFHSAFWTKEAIYTFGLHAGQLGHPQTQETTIVVPRIVTCLDQEVVIKCAAASDGATAVIVVKKEIINIIYVFYRYQTKRIVSRLSFCNICVVGGSLNAGADSKLLMEQGGETLQVITLSVDGRIHLWQETSSQLEQCTFNLHRRLVITDVCISRSHILLATDDGNGFLGEFSSKIKSKVSDGPHIKIQRLPYLHRTTSITSDPKGRNFAAIQVHPRSLETPKIGESEFMQDLASLLVDASETDSLHDIIFEVGSERYPAHKYILSLTSALAKSQQCIDQQTPVVKIDNVNPIIFHQLLLFVYSGDCDLIHPGRCHIKILNNSKREDPLRLLSVAAIEYKVDSLVKIIQSLRYDGNTILTKEGMSLVNLKKSKPSALDHKARKDLYDVHIKANDGGSIEAHKCVLTARLDYFRNMLLGGWVEGSVTSPLVLPFSTAVLTDLINFIYTDSESSLSNPYDLEHVCSVLIVADELCISRLKKICEVALSVCLNLRNAGLLLQFASTYNAPQLRTCCMSFIAVNLSAILEMRTLEIVSLDVLNSLTEYIRSTVNSFAHHVITPFSDAPKDEEVLSAAEKFAVPWDEEDDNSSINDLGLESEWLKNLVPGIKHGKSVLSAAPGPAKKKQRPRKLSTNEAQRRRYESVGSTRDLELTLESSLSRSFNDCDEQLREDDSSLGLEKSQRTYVIAQLKDNDLHPSMFIPLPGSRNRKTSDKIDDCLSPAAPTLSDTSSFPQLSDQIITSKTPLKKKSNIVVKRSAPVKLSQKQQKKLAAESVSPTSKSPATSSPTTAWANIASPQSNISFTDILRETRNNSSYSSPDKSDKLSSPHPDKSIPCLSDIVADELKQKENWSRMRSKPFYLTQIEDKAIENLLAFYNAENVTDERITVQRVVRGTFAMPTWFKSKR